MTTSDICQELNTALCVAGDIFDLSSSCVQKGFYDVTLRRQAGIQRYYPT